MAKGEENDRSSLGVVVDPCVRVEVDLGDGKKRLTLEEMKGLYKRMQNGEEVGGKKYLHELLLESEIIIPKLEVPKRNPVLEARITALRNSLAEKEYQRMTQNVSFSSSHRIVAEDSIGYQMKQMNSALIGVFQFILSIACAFFFGFKGIEVFAGELQLAVRLLLGLAIALVVGAAELYFLAIRMDFEEDPSQATIKPPVDIKNAATSAAASKKVN